LARVVFARFTGFATSVHVLPLEVDLLELLHLLVVFTLVDDVIVVKHALVALISLEFRVRQIVIFMIELIISFNVLLILDVLHLSYFLFPDSLGYFWFGRRFAQLIIFNPHVWLVEMTGGNIVVEV
jgi:hypothetical protein